MKTLEVKKRLAITSGLTRTMEKSFLGVMGPIVARLLRDGVATATKDGVGKDTSWYPFDAFRWEL